MEWLPLSPYRMQCAKVVVLNADSQVCGWKAQTRLCKRYRDLSRTGKPQPRVLAAVARKLAGFI